MNELQLTPEQEYKLSCAKDFVERTREDLKSVTKSFFSIGFRLNEANEMKYFENLGYPNIESLAEEEFGFKRSTTYGLIKVFRRFCVKRDCGYVDVVCTNQMIDEFKDYSYSQLLEISKCHFLPVPIRECIPVSSSVRDIAAYVSEYNNPKISVKGTLPQWKAKKAEEQTLLAKSSTPANPLSGQLSIKDTLSDEQDFDTWLENQPEGTFVQGGGLDNDYQPTRSVQTSGLQPCAEPVPKQEKPPYNFQTRDNVRKFLNECCNWKKGEYHSPFIGAYYYTLKNKRRIYVYIQRTASRNNIDGIYEVIHRFFIDLNQYSSVPVEITKEQFEKYCAEHKDEL